MTEQSLKPLRELERERFLDGGIYSPAVAGLAATLHLPSGALRARIVSNTLRDRELAATRYVIASVDCVVAAKFKECWQCVHHCALEAIPRAIKACEPLGLDASDMRQLTKAAAACDFPAKTPAQKQAEAVVVADIYVRHHRSGEYL